jgi:hypothetical protein
MAGVGARVHEFVLELMPPTANEPKPPPKGDHGYTYLALGDSIPNQVSDQVLALTPPNPIEPQLDLLGISPVDPLV